jgi:hypothetical protein
MLEEPIATHLTLPVAAATGPLPFPAQGRGEGNLTRPYLP